MLAFLDLDLHREQGHPVSCQLDRAVRTGLTSQGSQHQTSLALARCCCAPLPRSPHATRTSFSFAHLALTMPLGATLKAEVEAYRVAARTAPAMDHGDVTAFTASVLEFWRSQGTKMPAWRKAAKIAFAIPPTSAASERVFSLLEAMFGKDQDRSLGDLIQGALMLRYNKRKVG